MTDSFQVAEIIASDFCFVKKQIACIFVAFLCKNVLETAVKKQIACIFVAFLCKNVLETAPAKGCRDQKSRKNFFEKSQKSFL